MNHIEPKEFNINERRPQVLLLGNGIPLLTSKAKGWDAVIEELSEKNSLIKDLTAPYSIKATISAEYDDNKRNRQYLAVFTGDNYPYSDNDMMKAWMKLPCDAVLTTNYTDEVEYAVNPKYISIKNKDRFVNSYEKKNEKKNDSDTERNKRESLYGHIRLFESTGLKDENGIIRDIWHIHGHIRVPSSIVLTHDEYARLTKAILNYNTNIGNRYSSEKKVRFKSWVDYLILGDLYIVGQGMNFSEFDLWWLLNRRIREKAIDGIGKVIFYEPTKSDEKDKINALRAMGVECRHMDISIDKDEPAEQAHQKYEQFYKLALMDAESEMK